jgi:deazaflavin-dependent oxidoreductase (nitroreductase family)
MSTTRPHINDHNREIIERFRANGGRLTDSGMPLVLLTHLGRISGRTYTNPLACATDGDDLIIAATMGGLPENPQWFRNVSANPRVTVEWNGEEFPAEARTVPAGSERDRLAGLLSEVITALPRYEQKAGGRREIPIVLLVRQRSELNRLELGELLKPVASQLPPQTGGLEATERGTGVEPAAVDVDLPGAHATSKPHGPFGIG